MLYTDLILHTTMIVFSSTESLLILFLFFFFNDTATTEIYTLSLHDALPIWPEIDGAFIADHRKIFRGQVVIQLRSEEHTSELQSQSNLVCRLLLEKKKNLRGLPESPDFVLVLLRFPDMMCSSVRRTRVTE